MQTQRMTRVIGIACTLGLFAMFVSDVNAGKRPRQVPQIPAPSSQIEPAPPTPMPMTILPPTAHIEGVATPCCAHKCCKRRDRKCKHSCEPVTCAPSIEYKGCPAPCSITRIVTVTHPKSCMTVEVPVQVPDSCREKIDRDKDGDLELDYGKYEVSLRWRDSGRRLVVHYDD